MKTQVALENPLARKAWAAMQDAIDKVIEDHRRGRMPLAVWQDGKVVPIQPEQATLARESSSTYRTGTRGRKR